MCTVSWRGLPDGLRLYFNRDERRTRKPAELPAVRSAGATRYIAPTDGDFGGSWIAVNDRGVLICLLNGYSDLDSSVGGGDDEYLSRGTLPLRFMECRSASEVLEQWAALDPERHRSFILAVLDGRGLRGSALWDRTRFRVDHGPDTLAMPLISSSFRSEQVAGNRRTVFSELRREFAGSPEELHLAYHAGHLPERGPYSACMHRPDARTVSFSVVTITPGRVSFGYVPHSPCRGLPSASLSVPRARP